MFFTTFSHRCIVVFNAPHRWRYCFCIPTSYSCVRFALWMWAEQPLSNLLPPREASLHCRCQRHCCCLFHLQSLGNREIGCMFLEKKQEKCNCLQPRVRKKARTWITRKCKNPIHPLLNVLNFVAISQCVCTLHFWLQLPRPRAIAVYSYDVLIDQEK